MLNFKKNNDKANNEWLKGLLFAEELMTTLNIKNFIPLSESMIEICMRKISKHTTYRFLSLNHFNCSNHNENTYCMLSMFNSYESLNLFSQGFTDYVEEYYDKQLNIVTRKNYELHSIILLKNNINYAIKHNLKLPI